MGAEYPVAFRQAVVKAVAELGTTPKAIAEQYGLHSRTVTRWLREDRPELAKPRMKPRGWHVACRPSPARKAHYKKASIEEGVYAALPGSGPGKLPTPTAPTIAVPTALEVDTCPPHLWDTTDAGFWVCKKDPSHTKVPRKPVYGHGKWNDEGPASYYYNEVEPP